MYPIMDQRVNEDTIRRLNDPKRIAQRHLRARTGNSVNGLVSLASDIGSSGVIVFAAVVGVVAARLFISGGTSA